MIAGMINYDDDVISVYNENELVFHGRYDEYFDDEFTDGLTEKFSFDASRGMYAGFGQAAGWTVVKQN